MNKILISLLCSCALFQGCSKSPKPVAMPEVSATAIQDTGGSRESAMADRSVDQADKNFPQEKYIEMKTGNQVLFTMLSASQDPINYEKIAGIYSNEYKSQKDINKKNDLLTTIKPEIDKGVSDAHGNRYFYMDLKDGIKAYDQGKQAFPVVVLDNMLSSGHLPKLNDFAFAVDFLNQTKFAAIHVLDEKQVQEIEAMSDEAKKALRVTVYYYVVNSDPKSNTIAVEITKLKVTDKTGKVIMEM